MVAVETAHAEQFELAVALMTAGFVDDPVCRYLYPALTQYLEHFPDYVRIYGAPGLAHGGTHLAGDLGAALWVPPNMHPDEDALDALLARSVAQDARSELFAVYAAFDRAHPRQPHWFLPLVAVDPFYRNKGLGAALMAFGLDMCDRDGAMAYLEATKPENVPFYERYGFAEHGLIDIGGHPPVTTMLRLPR